MLNWENMSNEGQGGATIMKIRWGKFPPQEWASIENDKHEEYVGRFNGILRNAATMLLSSVLILPAIF